MITLTPLPVFKCKSWLNRRKLLQQLKFVSSRYEHPQHLRMFWKQYWKNSRLAKLMRNFFAQRDHIIVARSPNNTRYHRELYIWTFEGGNPELMKRISSKVTAQKHICFINAQKLACLLLEFFKYKSCRGTRVSLLSNVFACISQSLARQEFSQRLIFFD